MYCHAAASQRYGRCELRRSWGLAMSGSKRGMRARVGRVSATETRKAAGRSRCCDAALSPPQRVASWRRARRPTGSRSFLRGSSTDTFRALARASKKWSSEARAASAVSPVGRCEWRSWASSSICNRRQLGPPPLLPERAAVDVLPAARLHCAATAAGVPTATPPQRSKGVRRPPNQHRRRHVPVVGSLESPKPWGMQLFINNHF